MGLAFSAIAGNDALRQKLASEIRSASLSHAYIIEGAKGSGKHTLALQIAAALACEHRHEPSHPLPCTGCLPCRKVLGGISPDVITIGRADKATLGVEAIRTLKTDVYTAPIENEVKVYVIEDAHTMTVQAQNAFLLTLEEPPSYVLFILLCETTATLLETIRSRAQVLHTEPIPIPLMDKHLCACSQEARTLKEAAPQEFAEILATADGCIGTAIRLLDANERKPILELRETAKQFVRLCSERKNSAATLRYLNLLGTKRDKLTEQLSAILLCLRDLLLCKQTDEPPLCFFAAPEEAHELAYRFTTPALLGICNSINEAIDRLRRNANVRLTLTALAVNTGLLQL